MYPFKRKEEVDGMLRENELHVNDLVVLSQSVKHSPFRVIIKGSNKTTTRQESLLSVCDENQQYTNAFVNLLKDYYLYL